MAKEHIDGGYIIISRQILENEIWVKSPAFLKIFLYILLKVNHKKGFFDVGENYFNFQEEKIFGVTKNQIYEFLRWAKSEKIKFCTTQKTTRGTVLKVNNYERFQNPKNYENQNTFQNPTKTDPKQTQNDKQECKNERRINLSLSNSSTRARVGKREREILKSYCKNPKNGVKNPDGFIAAILRNGDYKAILEKETKRLQRKQGQTVKSKSGELVPDITEEEASAIFANVKNKLRRGDYEQTGRSGEVSA